MQSPYWESPYEVLLTSYTAIKIKEYAGYKPDNLMPVYQRLALLTNQSDCWLCQHFNNAKKKPKLVFVSANVNTWWTKYRRWVND